MHAASAASAAFAFQAVTDSERAALWAHVAIHDALNAIDRRSHPYALDVRARRGASPDAAVAAAARDVLVPTLMQLPAPFSQACIDAGVTSVEADNAEAIGGIADGRARRRGIEVGRAAAAAILDVRAADGADTPLQDFAYRQGTSPGEYRFTPDRPFAFAPGWGGSPPSCCETPRNSVQALPTR